MGTLVAIVLLILLIPILIKVDKEVAGYVRARYARLAEQKEKLKAESDARKVRQGQILARAEEIWKRQKEAEEKKEAERANKAKKAGYRVTRRGIVGEPGKPRVVSE